jgi:hypothetical protein
MSFSHDYTKLREFKLADPATSNQNISSHPYGDGDDLSNWSTHTTKLTLEYELQDRWMVTGSARYLWGYPGTEDMASYNRDVLGNLNSLPLRDESGSLRAY